MILSALEEYNKICVSTAEKIDIKTKGIEGDLRYTNDVSYESSDLKKFVDKLIEGDILKAEWVKHPFTVR